MAEIAAVPGGWRRWWRRCGTRASGWSRRISRWCRRGGEPFISPHLKRLRPFLAKGDFASGGWGHANVDEVGSADMAVEKVAYSVFYMSRLEWVLGRAGVRRLFVSGIVTNGGVSSTVRDAAVRDYEVTVLSDGCAAMDRRTHEVAIEAVRPVAKIAMVAEALGPVGGSSAD